MLLLSGKFAKTFCFACIFKFLISRLAGIVEDSVDLSKLIKLEVKIKC